MTVQPSPAAIRARAARERRKAATPPDVHALIERGRQERAELERQARDVAALGRLLSEIDARWARIKSAASVVTRARMLGDLADFLADEDRQELLNRTRSIGPVVRVPRMPCPPWVPADMQDAYRRRSHLVGEIAAASEFRKIKREAEENA